MKEQITEDFADELLSYIIIRRPYPKEFTLQEVKNDCIKDTKEEWQERGFITQSREEEIKELIRQEKESEIKYPINYQRFYYEAVELIEILEEKLNERRS